MSLEFELSTGELVKTTDTVNHAVGTGDFTIGGWIKPESISAAYQVLFSWSGAAPNICSCTPNASKPQVQLGGGDRFFAEALSAGAWYHLAVSRASGVLKGYINGVEKLSVSDGTSLTNNTRFQIGGYQNDTPSFPYDGLMLDWFAHKASMSAPDLLDLYTRRLWITAKIAPNVCNWRLDSPSSGSAQNSDPGMQDLSGNGHHLIIVAGQVPVWNADNNGLSMGAAVPQAAHHYRRRRA